jgi:hypothetical protein
VGLKATTAQKEKKALVEILVPREHPEDRGHPDHRDRGDHPEDRGHPGGRDHRDRGDHPEDRGHRDHRGHREIRRMTVIKEPKEMMETLGQKVKRGKALTGMTHNKVY